MANEKRLYIAYGSNLNIGQMARRCPTAKVVGKCVMNGWRLMFRGEHEGAVATVERHKGGRVPVLVWELKPADELALDRYEGFPSFYRKETVDVNLNGEQIEAMVYIMNINDGQWGYRPLNQPGTHYYSVILEGYNEAGFNPEFLRRATERSYETKNNK